ncbi:hypothetical protein Tsubulata_003436 [Turnera subulata]|uniref:Uncharacterized protein n=1 Tax=Turnera subulata TaxID=218843 RepID=A0A9Q0JEC2_9ROSI|nr:hypothetical protein Tsubulata_003436 [Turnera subulata]
MVFEPKEGNKADKKLSRQNRIRREKGTTCGGSTGAMDNVSNEANKCNDSIWEHSQDEDYIVFCFREDGDFDVVKGCESEESLEPLDSASKNARSVNRKLNFAEVTEVIRISSHKRRGNLRLTDGDTVDVRKVESEENTYFDAESHHEVEPERIGNQIQEIEDFGTLSAAKSSDSNKSDGSTDSFSFPVLHWEFMGSPVQMPKSEDLHMRKHRVHCARFQCCRF